MKNLIKSYFLNIKITNSKAKSNIFNYKKNLFFLGELFFLEYCSYVSLKEIHLKENTAFLLTNILLPGFITIQSSNNIELKNIIIINNIISNLTLKIIINLK